MAQVRPSNRVDVRNNFGQKAPLMRTAGVAIAGHRALTDALSQHPQLVAVNVDPGAVHGPLPFLVCTNHSR